MIFLLSCKRYSFIELNLPVIFFPGDRLSNVQNRVCINNHWYAWLFEKKHKILAFKLWKKKCGKKAVSPMLSTILNSSNREEFVKAVVDLNAFNEARNFLRRGGCSFVPLGNAAQGGWRESQYTAIGQPRFYA